MRLTGIMGAFVGLFIALILVSNIPMNIFLQVLCIAGFVVTHYFLGIFSEYMSENVYIFH